MKKTYRVGVREVHVRSYVVEAGSDEEAKTLVDQRAPSAVDQEELEYSHELDRETWSVEEVGNGGSPETGAAAVKELAHRIFEIVCDSDWPEKADAWPEEAILRALEEAQP